MTTSPFEGSELGLPTAGPSGPAVGPGASRPEIAISGWRWPGGAHLSSPTPEDPHWREPSGEPLSLSDVVAGQRVAVREQVLELHRDAIADIVGSATEAVLTDRTRVRRHVAAATRLCNELLVR